MILKEATTIFPTEVIKSGASVINSILADSSLSLFQKTLLVTDGTVTSLLALYTGETIKVKKIAQEITLSNETEIFLCPLETPVLRRTILLSGKNRHYVFADSIFVFELLSRSTQYKLLETDQPIGLLWKEEKLEMYREIIEYKNEPCENLTQYFELPPQVPILSRTYLIYHQRKILGVITEKFPITYFKGEN